MSNINDKANKMWMKNWSLDLDACRVVVSQKSTVSVEWHENKAQMEWG